MVSGILIFERGAVWSRILFYVGESCAHILKSFPSSAVQWPCIKVTYIKLLDLYAEDELTIVFDLRQLNCRLFTIGFEVGARGREHLC